MLNDVRIWIRALTSPDPNPQHSVIPRHAESYARQITNPENRPKSESEPDPSQDQQPWLQLTFPSLMKLDLKLLRSHGLTKKIQLTYNSCGTYCRVSDPDPGF